MNSHAFYSLFKHMAGMLCGIVGAAVLFICIRFLFPLLLTILRFLRMDRSYARVRALRQGPDDWAVVTGGTDGIGLAYAKELAGLGFNICLISRNSEKLETVSGDIRDKYNVQTRWVQADFTQTDIYEKIRDTLKAIKVMILVNNVGMTQSFPCNLHEMECEDSFYTGFSHCNMTSAVIMTRSVLREGGMLERRCGLVINISSASGLFPIPMASMYCATKSFVDFFSRGVSQELAGTGVQLQTVLPFYVQTKFIGRFRPPAFLTPSAEDYVKSALATVGLEPRTHGTLSHAIQGLVMCLPPECLRLRVAKRAHAYRAKCVRGQ